MPFELTSDTMGEQSSFSYYWATSGEWVEEPNRRRGGESGVQRVLQGNGTIYVKRQLGHIYRSVLHPLGRPTVLRERDALICLSRLNVRVPRVIFCGAERDATHGWKALLVTAPLDGFESFENWMSNGGYERYGEAAYEQILKDLAENLARMHRGRWQHGSLFLKHVFVRAIVKNSDVRWEVALLDLEKSRRRFSASRAAAHDMKELRRHWPLSDIAWRKLLSFYGAAFGATWNGLEH
jgi:Lipopolysaccharide kinase (Kdo/WaaP) family